MSADSASASQLRAQLSSYRHLVRGVAPPPTTWQRAAGQPAAGLLSTPLSSDALLAAEAASDEHVLARLAARQADLRDVPVDLPPPIRQPLALERQMPSMLHFQRAVRAEVGGFCDRVRLLDEASSSLSLRRARRIRQPRELREAERTERKRKEEMDIARRTRRTEFLNALNAHSEEFKGFHREARRTSQRLGKAVLLSFEMQARKERRDQDRTQRERLRALKENNMDEYMKLVSSCPPARLPSAVSPARRARPARLPSAVALPALAASPRSPP